MTFEQFDELTDDMIKQVLKMRSTKGQEYANSEADRLKNFTDIAEECGVSPLVVWQVYFKKHIRAIDSYIKRGEVLSESIEGRFVDAITYLLLGYGLIVDAAEVQDKQRAASEQQKYEHSCASQARERLKVCVEYPHNYVRNAGGWYVCSICGTVNFISTYLAHTK